MWDWLNPSPTEKLRKNALKQLNDLKRKNLPRINDPHYQDRLTGYNMASWANQGYDMAIEILGNTKPNPDESLPDYAKRLYAELEQAKDFYYNSRADQDGGATGAVTDALLILKKLAGMDGKTKK